MLPALSERGGLVTSAMTAPATSPYHHVFSAVGTSGQPSLSTRYKGRRRIQTRVRAPTLESPNICVWHVFIVFTENSKIPKIRDSSACA